MNLTEKLQNLIVGEMPPGARVEYVPQLDGTTFAVHQKIYDDPTRPNKPAKIIAIHFSHEAIADMALQSDVEFAQSVATIQLFIQNQLEDFDPSHNHARHVPPPVERWIVFADGNQWMSP